MRVAEQDELKTVLNKSYKAGFIGAAAGIAISLAASVVAHRSWAAYRQLSVPLKTFFVISSGTLGGMVAGEEVLVHEGRMHVGSADPYQAQHAHDLLYQQDSAPNTKR
eukprot:m.163368 g.163368  ORF g.163368 m.163368 type:complete len:108 (+) comp21033_c0_seq1:81-404(+)